MKTEFFVLALVLLFGLSSLEAQQEPSMVWFYRMTADDSDISPTVWLMTTASARRLATLDRGQFFGLRLDPGIYVFSWTRVPAQGERVFVTVAPGRQVFLEVQGRSISTPATEKALQDMQGMEPVRAQNVFDAAVILPTEIPLPAVAAVPATPPGDIAPQRALSPVVPQSAIRATGNQPEELGYIEPLNAPRRYEIFLAPYSYSKQGSVNLRGGDLSLAVKLNDTISLVADASAHRAARSGQAFFVSGATDLKLWNFRFGPKFTVRPSDRITLFTQALAGRSHVTYSTATSVGNAFSVQHETLDGLATAFGGGVDLAISRWFALRIIQGEYSFLLYRDGYHSQGARLGGGLMFRIR